MVKESSNQDNSQDTNRNKIKHDTEKKKNKINVEMLGLRANEILVKHIVLCYGSLLNS